MTGITLIQKNLVRGFVHRPVNPNNNGLILTHGAGANCRTALLMKIADAFSQAGWYVLRCDLAFRQRRASGPPSPATAQEDRKSLKQAVTELRLLVSGRIFLGGHSYGGRQASILLAEEPNVAEGLICFSYPLHPPAKPQALRTGHFPDLRSPAMFVHGTRDPFGSVEELQAALGIIPTVTALVTIPAAGHDLLQGRFDLSENVIAPFERLTGVTELPQ